MSSIIGQKSRGALNMEGFALEEENLKHRNKNENYGSDNLLISIAETALKKTRVIWAEPLELLDE